MQIRLCVAGSSRSSSARTVAPGNLPVRSAPPPSLQRPHCANVASAARRCASREGRGQLRSIPTPPPQKYKTNPIPPQPSQSHPFAETHSAHFPSAAPLRFSNSVLSSCSFVLCVAPPPPSILQNEPKCAGKAGEVLHMKEMYSQGPANQTGPESCVTARKDGREALTGAHAGWVLSLESVLVPGADAHLGERKATRAGSSSREPVRPGGARDPRHAWTHLAQAAFAVCRTEATASDGSREIPASAQAAPVARIVNPSEGVRR